MGQILKKNSVQPERTFYHFKDLLALPGKLLENRLFPCLQFAHLLSMSSDEIQGIICDPIRITDYFNLHTTINPEELSAALCDINATMFLDEFINTFSIRKLMDQMSSDNKGNSSSQN